MPIIARQVTLDIDGLRPMENYLDCSILSVNGFVSLNRILRSASSCLSLRVPADFTN